MSATLGHPSATFVYRARAWRAPGARLARVWRAPGARQGGKEIKNVAKSHRLCPLHEIIRVKHGDVEKTTFYALFCVH